MPKINLLGGTYQARSVIANAQPCINLYPETNPQDAGAPTTHYPTPGLTLLASPSPSGPARGLYTTTNGFVFYVCGTTLFRVVTFNSFVNLGTISGTNPVGMQDNGSVLIIVNGAGSLGWAVNIVNTVVGGVKSTILQGVGGGGVAGVYPNVLLSGGTGIAAIGTFTVAGGVTSYQITSPGGAYTVGDLLSIPSSQIPGISGVSIYVSAVTSAQFAFAAINDPGFLGGTNVAYVDTFFVLNQPGKNQWYVSNSNIDYTSITSNTSGSPQAGALLAAGSGGTPGTYNNASLTGGSGINAMANIVIGAGGSITSVVVLPSGQGYQAGDFLTTSVGSIVGAQFEITQVNPIGFNVLNTAKKTGYPDVIAQIEVVHREIWLLGANTSSEIWYDAGNALFPFQIMPGIFIQHGTVAPYSVATYDLDIFWVSADLAGFGHVYMGRGYRAQRISTFAIEQSMELMIEAQRAGAAHGIDDAVGFVYKQSGHTFYVLTFPTGDQTWVYDVETGLWHQRVFTDSSGVNHKVLYNCITAAYPFILAGDAANGKLYSIDPTTFTDNGQPILRKRGLPHMQLDGNRVSYEALRADMDCGNGLASPPTPTVTALNAGTSSNFASGASGGSALAAAAAGSTIIIGLCPHGGDLVQSLVDSAGNTYVRVQTVNTGTGQPLELWQGRILANVLPAAGTWTATTFGGNAWDIVGAVVTAGGGVTGAEAAVAAVPTGTTISLQTGPLLTTSELIIGMANLSAVAPGSYTESAGFTTVSNPTSAPHFAFAYQVVSSTSSVVWQPTLTGSNAVSGQLLASFKLAAAKPVITLLISDDRGKTFYEAPPQSLGETGNTRVQPQWRQLGIARDRVFALQWSAPSFTALDGVWADFTPSET